jgi:Ni,Fe-hydrogenase I small subunit
VRYDYLPVTNVLENAMIINTVTGNPAASLGTQAANRPVQAPSPEPAPVASLAAGSQAANPTTSNKVAAVAKKTEVASISGPAKPPREMSHVVEVYNIHGKVRTKFLDSHNNLIYQIPSEMKAKLEDLMMKPETATDIKA